MKICLFILTECTNVTDTQTDIQTDGQTPHDHIGCAWIASRGKKQDHNTIIIYIVNL